MWLGIEEARFVGLDVCDVSMVSEDCSCAATFERNADLRMKGVGVGMMEGEREASGYICTLVCLCANTQTP